MVQDRISSLQLSPKSLDPVSRQDALCPPTCISRRGLVATALSADERRTKPRAGCLERTGTVLWLTHTVWMA